MGVRPFANKVTRGGTIRIIYHNINNYHIINKVHNSHMVHNAHIVHIDYPLLCSIKGQSTALLQLQTCLFLSV